MPLIKGLHKNLSFKCSSYSSQYRR